MQRELGDVVVNDCPQIFPTRGCECLNGLQNFNGQALGVLDPFEVVVVGTQGRLHSLFGCRHLLASRFDLGVGFGHYCLLLAAANLAIIIPTFFGGTGPFEWAVKLVLTGAGVNGATAGAYSVVSHAFILIPTTILGLILLWSFGVSFRRITHVDLAEEPARIV